jgi:hypothetical protein
LPLLAARRSWNQYAPGRGNYRQTWEQELCVCFQKVEAGTDDSALDKRSAGGAIRRFWPMVRSWSPLGVRLVTS